MLNLKLSTLATDDRRVHGWTETGPWVRSRSLVHRARGGAVRPAAGSIHVACVRRGDSTFAEILNKYHNIKHFTRIPHSILENGMRMRCFMDINCNGILKTCFRSRVTMNRIHPHVVSYTASKDGRASSNRLSFRLHSFAARRAPRYGSVRPSV